MKRIHRYSVLLMAGLLPLCMAFGQEKKNEQKIKVIIDDGSGVKTLIDTIYVISRAGSSPDKKVIIASAGDAVSHMESTGGEKVIIVKDGRVTSSNGNESYTVTVSSDIDSKTDVTKYVIAKDGIVVTVEGNDEAKAREILEMIQSKLDIKDNSGSKDAVKEETKKTVKK
jgi:hypothetical protein